MADKLKLIIKDITDLSVLSTLMQDAVVTIEDMDYSPAAQQFLMVVARLDGKTQRREKTGIHIASVTACKHIGIDRKQKKQPLMLLSITYSGDAIDVTFSGNAMLKLATTSLEIYAVDLDEGWPTAFTPSHKTAFED